MRPDVEHAPPPETLSGRVLAVAASCPERVAIRDRDGALTYAELVLGAQLVAGRLREHGVRTGELIGVVASRDRRTVLGMLAVLLCGAAYVPLEPTLPEARLAPIAELARLRLCLVPDPGEPCPLPGLTAIPIEAPGAGSVPGDAPVDDSASDALAYVIFTSGSTGAPKGVPITHAAVLALLAHMGREPGLAPGQTMLGVTTPAFDLSVPDLYLPLITGATLVLAPRATCSDGVALRELVETERPDLMQATPSTWRLLLAAGWTGDPSLRGVCGGEGYEASLARTLVARTGGLWNFYGPTETTVWSVSQRLDGAVEDPIPIGFPIPGTWCEVVRDDGTSAAPGESGELVIGGLGVSPGYLARPDLTAAAFVDVPVAGRAFRTGDFVRRDHEGRLTFVERRDGQVKLRGYRVELGDVEAAARALPEVEQAVAVTVGTPPTAIVLYVVTGSSVADRSGTDKTGTDPSRDAETLRSRLADLLPEYMVPARVEARLSFPLTGNGKVDRRALATLAADAAPHESASPDVAAADASGLSDSGLDGVAEELVAQVWAEVLAGPIPSRDDDFFALGGDSLAATRIVTRVTENFGVRLTAIDLFQAPTVAEFALVVLAAMIADGTPDNLDAAVHAEGGET